MNCDLTHPPYPSDSAPCDNFLFPIWIIRRDEFKSDEIIARISAYFKTSTTPIIWKGPRKLEKPDEILELKEDNVEK